MSRTGCSTPFATPTSCSARTRAGRRSSSTATGSGHAASSACTATTRPARRASSCHASRPARCTRSSRTPASRGSTIPGAGSWRLPSAQASQVTVLPGPSAVETALVVSGLGVGPYRFLGFLPRRAVELEALWKESLGWADTAVAFESPKRLGASLAALARSTPTVVWQSAASSRSASRRRCAGRPPSSPAGCAEPVKGEVTLVVAPGAAPAAGVDDAVRAVQELVAAGAARRAAADTVARLVDASRNELYRRSLAPPIDAVRRPRYSSTRRVARAENEGGARCIVFFSSPWSASRHSS